MATPDPADPKLLAYQVADVKGDVSTDAGGTSSRSTLEQPTGIAPHQLAAKS